MREREDFISSRFHGPDRSRPVNVIQGEAIVRIRTSSIMVIVGLPGRGLPLNKIDY